MVQERRQHPRLTPSSPLFVCLGESKRGLLLDVCEGGLAVASLVPRNLDEVISLAFDLPDSELRIQATAEIAWTRDSGHLTGVRFVDLADASRQQLEKWISAGADAPSPATTEAVAASTPESVEPAQLDFVAGLTDAPVSPLLQVKSEATGPPQTYFLVSQQLTEEPNPKKTDLPGNQSSSSEDTSRYPTRLFLAVMLLSWALVFLGYRMGVKEVDPQVREVSAAAKALESTSREPIAPVSPLPKTTPSPLRSASWNDPGVVFQVGAMARESNADALAEALQKKSFPAFVFRRRNDRFYKVAVGPFSDAGGDSSAKVKNDLEKQGFKPILKPWLPE
jgi:hypothetical protein